MKRVASTLIPKVLTEEQKRQRVERSQEMLSRVCTDPNFLIEYSQWMNRGSSVSTPNQTDRPRNGNLQDHPVSRRLKGRNPSLKAC